MKTARRVSARLLVALVAALGACADDGPTAVDEPDAADDVRPVADTSASADSSAPPDPGDTGDLTPDDVVTPDAAAQVGDAEDATVDDVDAADANAADAAPGEAAMPCDDARPCASNLVCVTVAATHEIGFCAPTCTTLHATCGYFGPGVHAECVLELPDGALACGFICELNHGDHVHDYSCPSGEWGRLRCERNAGPFGHRYCAPRQD